ncbi:hypothetical protein L210DRAFT_3550764 [Boletus edulis BED1]|uniref:DUF6534 domain-containing protein n=1 Tax=Boletus edulis BED1 TaxID=1328754 RepID=A0AAD4GCV9_BOLED|nr:hypothetical protein L210DRAFT_3550764 [Boletus edulis BED1]
MTSVVQVDTTFGALLLGGFSAAALSGVVVVQTLLYIKLFPQDSARIKSIVGAVWTLDTTHSLLVYTSIWIYLITNYGDVTKIDTIPIPLALTVINTAILTFIVHCFFSHRIHKLSRRQWRITALILVLAFFRLCCATVTTVEMIHKKTFTAFKAEFRWVFTLGLAMSCLVDILVTGFLTHSLQTLQNDKRASTSLDRVIGAVVLYTFETNLLTSAATIVSMICWLTMPDNLVFMGLHFFISKLYANSLLATLNTRKHLQHQRQRGASADFPAGFPRFSSTPRRTTGKFSVSRSASLPCALILPFI